MIKKYGSPKENESYTDVRRFGDSETGKRYLLEKNERDNVVARRRSMLRLSSSSDSIQTTTRGNRLI